jgi:CRP-like cAMP-binding protein
VLSNAPIASCGECTLGRASGPPRCSFAPFTRESDAVLCAQGERPWAVLFVKSGLVSISSLTSRGAERAVAVRGPSSLLCLEALRGERSPVEVRALSRVRLCALSGEEMKRWVGPSVSPARAVVELLVQENALQRSELNFREGSCLRRVAQFALAYARFLEQRPDFVRKQVLARMLGMRAETLSRCLTRLERCGAIDASHGVRVQYPRVLSAIASGTAA